MNKQLLVIALITITIGCATSYDTKKSRWTGNMGFSETQLGTDLWQVDFTGNTHTDRDTTKKYVLKKAAEIALREGYPYFKSVEVQTNKDTTGAYSTGYLNTWGASQIYANSKTSTNITVQLLKTKDGQVGIVYDARFLVGSVPSN